MVMISGDSAGHSDSQSQTDDDNNHLTLSMLYSCQQIEGYIKDSAKVTTTKQYGYDFNTIQRRS